jgi:hypothetical protein
MKTYVGRSNNLSVDDAIADIVRQLPAHTGPGEPPPVELVVTKISYGAGGIIGPPTIFVEME